MLRFSHAPSHPIFKLYNRTEVVDMGAGGKFQYPKEVWSPAGGWWAYPAKWRSNTAFAFVALAAMCVPVFILSEQKSVRDQIDDR